MKQAERSFSRPNVILITTDQQRWDTLGCYGNPLIQTPNLDRMANEGIRFNRAYVNNPVCSPSRATMMTGRYPRAHGLTANGKELPHHERTLAHILNEQGYRTAAFGKIHLSPTSSKDHERYIESKPMNEDGKAFFRKWTGPYYGFEYVEMSIGHTTSGNKGHYRLWLEDQFPDAIKHFDKPVANSPKGPSGAPFGTLKWGLPAEAHSSRWVVDRAIDELERHRRICDEQPFFMWVSFQDPHPPLACPEPYCDMYDPDEVPAPIPAPKLWSDLPPYFEEKHKGRVKTNPYHAGSYNFPGGGVNVDASMLSEVQIREMISHYYGMITLVDEQIGRLMRKLEEYDLEQDTLIIFTSDHGELLGDHGLWLKGPYHYEGLIRVPMMWKYPARILGGRESDALFSHVDLVPTLLELCSIRSMPGVQGVSQAAVMEGKSDRVRKDALCEFRIHHEWPALNVKTLITASHKLTVYAGYDFGELYDLATDPSEQRNLWNDMEYRNLKEELTKTLFTRLMQTEDPLPPQICDY